MKFKHYKFPPQSYPPRISFKLMIKQELIVTDETLSRLDSPISTTLVDSDAEPTCMIDTLEKQAGITKSE